MLPLSIQFPLQLQLRFTFTSSSESSREPQIMGGKKSKKKFFPKCSPQGQGSPRKGLKLKDGPPNNAPRKGRVLN